MKLFIIAAAILMSLSKAQAEQGSCIVSSRGTQIDKFEFYSTFPGGLAHYPIRQNDNSIINYDVSVSAAGGELEVYIANHDKTVSVGTWQATELVARGSTQLRVGTNLVVETGFEALTLKSLVTVNCSVTK